MKKFKYIAILLLLLALFILVSANSYATTISQDLSKNFLDFTYLQIATLQRIKN